MKGMIFSEKYRPDRIEDMVGDHKDKIKNFIKEPESIPHLLLYSKTPGCGKTTLAKAIINELGCDALIINSSDERKIETIRAKVKEFAMTKSTNGLRRCVFLDEADGMNKISMESLRNIMETYAKNAFFILTCNNIAKIIEPLRSRCVEITFSNPKKEEIKVYLKKILEEENLEYDEEGIDELIDKNYPSIRNCVLAIQDLKYSNKSLKKENLRAFDDEYKTMWEALKKKDYKTIKEKVLSSNIDARELNMYFWRCSVEEELVKILQITCRNERDMCLGANPDVILVTSLIEMITHTPS